MTTLENWVADMVADSYSRTTIRSRTVVVGLLARAAGVDPDQLATEHVRAYLTSHALAPATRRSYLCHAAAWCAYAEIPDATLGIRRPRQPRGVPRPISEAQLARLVIAAGPGTREHAWLVLGAYAGTRSFETAKVAAEDLEVYGSGSAIRIVGKGGVIGLVPVPDVVVDTLQPWIDAVDGQGRLWPKVSAQVVRNALSALGRRAGVRFASHQLRHRYGTAIYRETRDLLLTQQLMRHASPATTAGYALVVADQAAAVVARLPGAGRAVGGTRG